MYCQTGIHRLNFLTEWLISTSFASPVFEVRDATAYPCYHYCLLHDVLRVIK